MPSIRPDPRLAGPNTSRSVSSPSVRTRSRETRFPVDSATYSHSCAASIFNSFANELKMDAAQEWLYVAESTGKRVSRLRVRTDGELTDREVFGPANLGPGLIDGITFDSYGNLWGTMIFADRLIAITPEGELLELLGDTNPEGTARFEAEFSTGEPASFQTLSGTGGAIAPWLASVTFGGPDLKTAYL